MNFDNKQEVNEYIELITRDKDPLRHANYDASVEHARQMSVHINGDPPGTLLEDYRPNESRETHEYRLSIYQPITKSKCKKIINVISRIKNTKNYKINWDEEKRPRNKLIKEKDSLEVFTTRRYPYFKSLSEWVFMVVLKQDLTDPNSVIAWKPIEISGSFKDENDYFVPFGHIFSSKDIWDYKVDEYYTLLTPEKSWVKEGEELVLKGNVINVYTRKEIIEFRQVGQIDKREYEITTLFTYEWNETPIVRLKGEYIENTFFLYESFISGILPYFNDAIREYSDKQATFVNHVFPERVEVEVECMNPGCKKGKVEITVRNEDGNTRLVNCGICSGTGRVLARSPFTNTIVRHKEPLDENEITFPGVEYIEKDPESVKLLVKDIDSLIFEGLSALNMEFLADVPLNQSGKAKEVDRTELSSFLQQISDNLFEVIEKNYWYINLWRYGTILSREELKENKPEIIRPTSFDLVTSDVLIQKINSIKDTSPQVADVLDDELAEKEFPNDPDKREFLRAISTLDPLPNFDLEEKNLAVQSKGVSQEDFIVSVNIVYFLRQLIEEDEGFLSLDRKEKIKKLRLLAKKTIDVIEKAKRDPRPPPEGDGQFGGQI